MGPEMFGEVHLLNPDIFFLYLIKLVCSVVIRTMDTAIQKTIQFTNGNLKQIL